MRSNEVDVPLRIVADGARADAGKILIVEEDSKLLSSLQSVLNAEGFEADGARTSDAAITTLTRGMFDAMLIDLQLPNCNGLEALERMRRCGLTTPAIVMTDRACLDSALQAMRLGVIDYLVKPIGRDALIAAVQRALAPHRPVTAVPVTDGAPAPSKRAAELRLGSIIAQSAAMEHVLSLVERVAPLDATVLITGETGTGKELVARAIHQLSARSNGAFVPVHCSALAPTLLESELFGHVRGSFTGAVTNRRGLFEEADGGSLFLDEVATITPDVQIKLLRVLQERAVQRVGATQAARTNFRLVAATNADLWGEVGAGRFRADLYYRLHVFPIRIPPLRERPGDIPLLVEHFRGEFARTHNIEPAEFPGEIIARLKEYDWPGNVRELENYVERALIVSAGTKVVESDLPASSLSVEREVLRDAERSTWTLAELEREYTMRLLEQTKGRQTEAASLLGISRRTLSRKLKTYFGSTRQRTLRAS